mgnify:CR=1 FL=1
MKIFSFWVQIAKRMQVYFFDMSICLSIFVNFTAFFLTKNVFYLDNLGFDATMNSLFQVLPTHKQICDIL